jgi:hypothetical protein
MFPEIPYEIEIIVIDEEGNVRTLSFIESVEFIHNELSCIIQTTIDIQQALPVDYYQELLFMVDHSEIPARYINLLKNSLILTQVVNDDLEAISYINRRKASVKGGYFEKLFYEFLRGRRNSEVIDGEITWRGIINDGIYYPSPAGTGSETDIEFSVDEWVIGLELTTATRRSQWKTEAESVTSHIRNLKARMGSRKIIGVFSAPAITDFMEAICFYFGDYVYKVPIIPIESRSFIEILIASVNSNDFIARLNEYYKEKFGKDFPSN